MRNSVTDIFFDLDHTLWDFEKNSALGFEAMFKEHRIPVALDEFLEKYVPINLEYWRMYRDGEISQEHLRYARLKDAFDAIGFDIDDQFIELLSDEYIRLLPTFNHLADSAVEVLEYLRRNYRLHIITNGFSAVQGNKLKNSNITHYFHTVTDSESTGVKKPHPGIFHHALQRAGVPCNKSVMIGDCIDADVRGAMSCGMHAILYHNVPCGDASIRQIFHLEELKQIL